MNPIILGFIFGVLFCITIVGFILLYWAMKGAVDAIFSDDKNLGNVTIDQDGILRLNTNNPKVRAAIRKYAEKFEGI